jgi:hypothetical protein
VRLRLLAERLRRPDGLDRDTLKHIEQLTVAPRSSTVGTRVAGTGVPLRTIQPWMGHADAKTTKVYAHYQPSDHEDNMVDQAFSGECSTPGLRHRLELVVVVRLGHADTDADDSSAPRSRFSTVCPSSRSKLMYIAAANQRYTLY